MHLEKGTLRGGHGCSANIVIKGVSQERRACVVKLSGNRGLMRLDVATDDTHASPMLDRLMTVLTFT